MNPELLKDIKKLREQAKKYEARNKECGYEGFKQLLREVDEATKYLLEERAAIRQFDGEMERRIAELITLQEYKKDGLV